MIFQNYHYEKPDVANVLECGDYEATIVSAIDKVSNGGNSYVEVTLAIAGHQDANPNKIFLYDIPTVNDMKANGQPVTEDDVKKACQTLSKFLDAFGIPAVSVSALASWRGKKGLVHCDWQYDKNEADHKSKKYKQLWPKIEKKQNEPMPQTAPAGDGFPEDSNF